MNILSHIRSLFSSEVKSWDTLRIFYCDLFCGTWKIKKRVFLLWWRHISIWNEENGGKEFTYYIKKEGAEKEEDRIHNESKEERRKKIRLGKMNPVESENVVYMSVPEIIDKYEESLSEKDIEHLKEIAK